MWFCANGCDNPWWAPIGVFHTWRPLTYSTALPSANRPIPTALAAPMIRSGFSPANNWAIAASSDPTSASAGSRTSSRNTWNWNSGLMISIGILV